MPQILITVSDKTLERLIVRASAECQTVEEYASYLQERFSRPVAEISDDADENQRERPPMGAAEALSYGLDRIEGVSHEEALAQARGENSDERLEAHVPEGRIHADN